MEEAIIRKLSAFLTNPVDTECKVVYLLCEARKLLDKGHPDPPPFALRLYCHWALHVDLSVPATTMRFLQKVDDFVVRKLTSEAETRETFLEDDALFKEFLYLQTFRAELSGLLKAHGLSASLCDDEARWFVFLAQYAGVIEDGSLTCDGKGSKTLRLVDRVTFTKTPAQTEGGHVPFGIRWDILLNDKRRLEVEVGTQEQDGFLYQNLRLFKPISINRP
ncbi:MAG: hypothetical protein ABSD98_12970 [Candidatus Korobacteraceae bacterium]|jgi:hypothetical protein